MPEPTPVCRIEGCGRPAWSRGLCGAHYNKLRLYGDPLAGKTRAPNGSGYICREGYHHVSFGGVEKPEHVRICEKAIGKPLPSGAVVHHVDGNRLNNDPSNLIICQDAAYHNLLHARTRAMAAAGSASARVCCRCGKYDSPQNLVISGKQAYHRECNRIHAKKMREKKNAEL